MCEQKINIAQDLWEFPQIKQKKYILKIAKKYRDMCKINTKNMLLAQIAILRWTDNY